MKAKNIRKLFAQRKKQTAKPRVRVVRRVHQPAEKVNNPLVYQFKDMAFSQEECMAIRDELQFIKSLESCSKFQYPDSIKKFLFPYQLEGLSFLLSIQQRGGILAHTMGLGKTLQIIAFLIMFFQDELKSTNSVTQNGIRKKILLVVPLSLTGNWENEFKVWTQKLGLGKPLLYSLRHSTNYKETFTMWSNRGGILLIHYEFLRKVFTYENDYFEYFFQSNINISIYDEGHIAKNAQTEINRAISMVSSQAKIILTGTPFQNNFDEYHNLLSIVRPKMFKCNVNFMNNFTKVIFSQGTNAINRFNLLMNLTSGIIHRRDWADIDEAKALPPKRELAIFIKYTEHQARHYLDSLEKNSDIFSLLIKNQIIATNGSLNEKIDAEELLKSSPKMNILVQIAQETVALGEKLLIFTRFSGLSMENIGKCLTKLNLQYGKINSSSSIDDRINKCKEFAVAPYNILLVSLKVGAFGLNITAASRVVLFDVSWNPADDTQASYRVYRAGQQRPTFIYRLVSAGTIEEQIYIRQMAKLEMSNNFKSSWKDINQSDVKATLTQVKFDWPEIMPKHDFRKIQKIICGDSVLTKLIATPPKLIVFIKNVDSLQSKQTHISTRDEFLELKQWVTTYFENDGT